MTFSPRHSLLIFLGEGSLHPQRRVLIKHGLYFEKLMWYHDRLEACWPCRSLCRSAAQRKRRIELCAGLRWVACLGSTTRRRAGQSGCYGPVASGAIFQGGERNPTIRDPRTPQALQHVEVLRASAREGADVVLDSSPLQNSTGGKLGWPCVLISSKRRSWHSPFIGIPHDRLLKCEWQLRGDIHHNMGLQSAVRYSSFLFTFFPLSIIIFFNFYFIFSV